MLSSLFSLDDERDEDVLTQYAAALTNAPEAAQALEKGVRMLNLFTNMGDLAGQVEACDALCETCRAGSGAPGRAIVDHGALVALKAILQGARIEPCRAAAELIAALCSVADQRRAVVRSGLLKPLIVLLRKASEPRLLREGARILAALAAEPSALPALLREDAPRALKHLCRSRAVACHAQAVQALGRLARADPTLLDSAGLPKVFCAVASSSVLEARAAAASELRMLLRRPSRRTALLSAGVVRVLLHCCDSLNEELKLCALHAIAALLTGATLAQDEAAATSPEVRAAEAHAAAEAATVAVGQLTKLGGVHVLVGLGRDESGRVVERALQLIEMLTREAVHHSLLEQAKTPQLLVELCARAAEHRAVTV